MSETLQVVNGLLKDEILHLDLRLGIIRYFFISYIRLTMVIKGRVGRVGDLLETEG